MGLRDSATMARYVVDKHVPLVWCTATWASSRLFCSVKSTVVPMSCPRSRRVDVVPYPDPQEWTDCVAEARSSLVKPP